MYIQLIQINMPTYSSGVSESRLTNLGEIFLENPDDEDTINFIKQLKSKE